MLYIVATPIGNREDITLRALGVLGKVDFILAEDTRKTGALLKHFNIKNKLVSFYDHNEDKKTIQVLNEERVEVTSLPGASSLITALSLSGISSDKFTFFGYLPRKKGARLKLISQMPNCPGSSVFLESPYRILRTLEELEKTLGNKKITVCRELTKKFEEVFESNLKEAVEHFRKKKPRGEFTLVLSSASF
jgi:16S rRNA (cytidine1402-2'-O)-methyltransferase